ncbi:MAG TPA: Mur ligase family protein, partial [Candidatus Deferrimicrobium sp.]|nr:Mur ligase family protein [Candidatus Deferrimicrobium sp.]
MPKHTYRQAERFLLSREFFGMKLGLENITRFLDFIGSPQRAYPTIHIAGTNGKGSVAAMLDAILRAAGYKCGLYTSPHLVDMRERIRVNGRKIPAPSVAAFVDRHRPELTKRKLSFFEVMTALALEHFEKTRVDVAVIETGLGGRLDATNVLAPLLTIVTDISHDHMDILGASLTKIAREKAGIIKPSTPHLVGLLP